MAGSTELLNLFKEDLENDNPQRVFFSGDFENATDNLEWDVAYKVTCVFLERIGLLSTYMKDALRLLLSPRIVDDREESW
jgi:hypothetical protein